MEVLKDFTNDLGQASDVGHSAAALVESMARVERLWMRHLQDAIDQPGFTPARLRLVGSLRSDGPQIMQHLATTTGTTPRNVTDLVDGLERDGLVERQRHPSDRRATVVALTPAGAELADAWRDAFSARAGAVFDSLPERDRQAFARILDRLAAALEAEHPG